VRALRLAAGAAVAAAALLATPATAKTEGGPPLPWPAEPVRCHLPGLATPLRCASLSRPLNPAADAGPRFALHYAVLPAQARVKAADPVVFLVGGPGQSALALAGPLAARFARLNAQRDLVFVDQRGTGRSAPLVCPDDEPAAVLQPLDQAWSLPDRLARLAACRQALAGLPHGDLRLYTTSLAMADLEALRQTLGVAQLNLIGASYGTRAGLEYLRQHPQRVRRLLLDGVVPPDMRLPEAARLDNQAAWQAVLAACRQEAACQQRHPDLAGQWAGVLASLPRQVQLQHPVTGQPQTVQLTATHLHSAVRAVLYAPALAAGLPEAVALAARGQFQPLLALASGLSPGGMALATGMHFSVLCAEDLPGSTPAAVVSAVSAAKPGAAAGTQASAPTAAPSAAQSAPAGEAPGLGDDLAVLYGQVCADWPRGQPAPGFAQVPASPAPVWLLSGGLDPVTPPRHGERVARSLGPLARHSVVPAWGHGVLGLACSGPAVQRFIQSDEAAQAAAQADALLGKCAAAVPRPPALQWPRLAGGGA